MDGGNWSDWIVAKEFEQRSSDIERELDSHAGPLKPRPPRATSHLFKRIVALSPQNVWHDVKVGMDVAWDEVRTRSETLRERLFKFWS